MPVVPAILPHQLFPVPQFAGEGSQNKKREFGRGLGEHVGSVGERNLVAIGIGAVDVIEPNRKLGHNFQRSLPCFEHLSVDLVANRGDETIHAAAQLLEDHLLRRRLGMRIDLDLIASGTQDIQRFFADVTGGKDTK